MPKNRVYFEGTEIGKLSMIVINNESGEVSHIDFDRYGKKRSAGNRSAPLIFWRNGEK